ncbi:MAG: hypothetical protein K1X83_10340 [Oligoflexia bacterium]|nr:hypothetical protein [Oligoflexia bacterium]
MGFEHATPGVLLLALILVLPVLYYIGVARRTKNLYVRRIPGVDAVDEAVGRSAELGKPICFSTGLSQIGPVLYASLGVLFHIARKAARYKNRLLVPQVAPDVMAIVEDTISEAYRREGRISQLDPNAVMYLSDEQFAFAAGYAGLVQREKIASAFLFGSFAAESLILAEAGQQVGAMQVAASVSPEQVAFFICTCDYTLIGEELFAASSYLTKEPVQLGTLYAQDRAKLLFFTMILIGVGIATLSSVCGRELANFDWVFSLGWDVLGGWIK